MGPLSRKNSKFVTNYNRKRKLFLQYYVSTSKITTTKICNHPPETEAVYFAQICTYYYYLPLYMAVLQFQAWKNTQLVEDYQKWLLFLETFSHTLEKNNELLVFSREKFKTSTRNSFFLRQIPEATHNVDSGTWPQWQPRALYSSQPTEKRPSLPLIADSKSGE